MGSLKYWGLFIDSFLETNKISSNSKSLKFNDGKFQLLLEFILYLEF